MSKAYCKRHGCGSWFNAAASTNEAQKYGYCSWSCLESDDPELAERIRNQKAAAEKAAWAVIIAVATAIFFGVKWLLKKRREDPPLFKKIMMWSGSVCAAMMVMGQFAGCANVADKVRHTAEVQCQSIRSEWGFKQYGIGEAAKDIAALEKAGMRCPDGGAYSIKDGELVCSKHAKF